MKTDKVTDRPQVKLTPVQAKALRLIASAEKRGKPLHAYSLAEYLGVKKAWALRIVRDLEAKGVVVRDEGVLWGLARPIRVVKRKDSQ